MNSTNKNQQIINKSSKKYEKLILHKNDFINLQYLYCREIYRQYVNYDIKFSFYNKDGNMADYPYDMLCIMDKE